MNLEAHEINDYIVEKNDVIKFEKNIRLNYKLEFRA